MRFALASSSEEAESLALEHQDDHKDSRSRNSYWTDHQELRTLWTLYLGCSWFELSPG